MGTIRARTTRKIEMQKQIKMGTTEMILQKRNKRRGKKKKKWEKEILAFFFLYKLPMIFALRC